MARILSVDDDRNSLQLVRAALEPGGHLVIDTSDPHEIGRLVEEHEFDVIILDVMMPEVDGWEILERLKADARVNKVGVLMLSAKGEVSDRVRGIRSGADDYLVKPFDREELLARVEALAQRRGEPIRGLQGNLESNPFLEVIQNLAQSAKSGYLEIASVGRTGHLSICDGRMIRASFASFEGREAIVAMSELDRGTFRFLPADRQDMTADATDTVTLEQILMEIAWLRDELLRRQAKLPPSMASLKFVREFQKVPEEMSRLPVVDVAGRIGANPGINLDRLLMEQFAAPLRVRVSLSWLIEGGYVTATMGPQGPTREPSVAPEDLEVGETEAEPSEEREAAPEEEEVT